MDTVCLPSPSARMSKAIQQNRLGTEPKEFVKRHSVFLISSSRSIVNLKCTDVFTHLNLTIQKYRSVGNMFTSSSLLTEFQEISQYIQVVSA